MILTAVIKKLRHIHEAYKPPISIHSSLNAVHQNSKKIVTLQCRFVRFLFTRLRKKSDKMTMKSEIM